MLTELIAQVAGEERRYVQILERRGAAPDHPVAASCLETAYLKCFILRVMKD
jgi:23S rRNA (cytosine1962-C5)-methyltransferase